MNNQFQLKKVLIAPLDWGLGHATRCIPLIKFLSLLGCEITIAASHSSVALLKDEFPNLNFLKLNAYNITYSRNKRWMAYKVSVQIPKILKAVYIEHKWLKNLLEKEKFDIIISDNRYGFYSAKTYSVFVTHQLQVNTAFKTGNNILRRFIYSHINHFNECWVPDFKGNINMAGKLSHPKTMPAVPVKYIGALSRFQKAVPQKIIYKYLIVISGPEPQRTLFEKKIFEFINSCKATYLIVLGKPEQKHPVILNGNCRIYNHLPTKEMEQALAVSEFVISRCGYTSVMEILSLKKKSILIPTPGQTEQEFLAVHLMQQKWCYTFLQNEDFDKQFIKAENFDYILPDINTELYKSFLQDFVSSL